MRRKTTIRKNREHRELIVERTVAMPAQFAWEGWTEPKHITSWWGPRMDRQPFMKWMYGQVAFGDTV